MESLFEASPQAHAGVGRLWRRRQVSSRHFCFAVIFTSVVLAKITHLYAHRHSIPLSEFMLWGATFFLQDLLFLLFVRALTDNWKGSLARMLAAAVAISLSIILLLMASITVSFYLEAGAEVHWRQMTTFLKDTSAAKTLASGSMGSFLVGGGILVVSWVITPYAHSMVGCIFQSLPSLVSRICCVGTASQRDYHSVDQYEDDFLSDEEEPKLAGIADDAPSGNASTRSWIVTALFCIVIVLRVVRPPRQAFWFISQTLVLSPLSNLGHGTGIDFGSAIGKPEFGEQCDSLAVPPAFEWLPEQELVGFEDWYPTENGTMPLHYSPTRDCSHISNLQNEILEPVRKALRENELNIKHIIVVKLETTRKDVFPLVKDNYMWKHVAGTHLDHRLPEEVEDGLRNLTTTIEYLTGDSTSGDDQLIAEKTRGGLTASDAFTASTYTLKSVIGTLCGIMPLSVDFNQEHRSHFYNPCMGHVLDAFNSQLSSERDSEDYRSWPWQSKWMQSVTDSFDKQDLLTPAMGYNESISRDTLYDSESKYYPPSEGDINYFGLPDTELKPYLRGAIEDAEANHERLFVTHLTGTTHHPWGLPSEFERKDYLGHDSETDLNNYLNTIKFIDGWMEDILSVLDDTGVANETLIVLAGDHGASLPEDGNVTPFDNPHVGVFRVPLVFSHPALPPIRLDAPASTMDTLPTILDLLISSSSLEEKSRKAASDILPFYEGQSLLRPTFNYTRDGHRAWQFTVLNPGGSWLSMRAPSETYRLLVPLAKEVAWRFTDLSDDPEEELPLFGFDFPEFSQEVNKTHGEGAMDWVEEASLAADWWLSKNHRLWRYEEE